MFVLSFIEHLHLLATQIPLEGKFTQSLSVIIEFTATLSYIKSKLNKIKAHLFGQAYFKHLIIVYYQVFTNFEFKSQRDLQQRT